MLPRKLKNLTGLKAAELTALKASWSITRNMSPAEFSIKTQKAESMTAEDYIADRKAEIDAYIKQNPVDMEFIFKMINSIRYGK